MSPPQLGAEEGSQGNVSAVPGSPKMDSRSCNDFSLKERNYLGLSDCSSVDSSSVSSVQEGSDKSNLNLGATELRLGLPGSQSPKRDNAEHGQLNCMKLEEIPLFPLLPSKDGVCVSMQKTVVLGNKRGFSDTLNRVSEMKGSMQPVINPTFRREAASKGLQECSHPTNGMGHKEMKASNNNRNAPAAKAQVVGWPPIRSFRKNRLATTLRNNDEVDGKPGPGTLFVKVSMDGAPYLRKVDLRLYSTYQELSSALEKMFSCFTLGQCGALDDKLSESKLRDLLDGSEYVLTYEDKDSDWMLVGDVPWEMFIGSCKRLKIMKSSDAIGLAPRAAGKSNKA